MKATTARNKTGKNKGKTQKPRADPYLSMFRELWPHILMGHKEFEDIKPILLFDIQEQRIYAYPYDGFKAELSERSQAILEEQYERALADEKIVVFVRDNDQKKLISYCLNHESFE